MPLPQDNVPGGACLTLHCNAAVWGVQKACLSDLREFLNTVKLGGQGILKKVTSITSKRNSPTLLAGSCRAVAILLAVCMYVSSKCRWSGQQAKLVCRSDQGVR